MYSIFIIMNILNTLQGSKGDWHLWEILKRQWVLHIKDNPVAYLLIIFVFITGIMTGTFTVISLSSQQKLNVSNFHRNF